MVSYSVTLSRKERPKSIGSFVNTNSLKSQLVYNKSPEGKERARINELNKKIEQTAKEIEDLKITSPEQIPEDVRPYIELPPTYWNDVNNYLNEKKRIDGINSAFEYVQKKGRLDYQAVQNLSKEDRAYVEEAVNKHEDSLANQQFLSSVIFYKQNLPTGEKVIPNLKTKEINISSDYFGKTFPVNKYIAEVKKLEQKSPTLEYENLGYVEPKKAMSLVQTNNLPIMTKVPKKENLLSTNVNKGNGKYNTDSKLYNRSDNRNDSRFNSIPYGYNPTYANNSAYLTFLEETAKEGKKIVQDWVASNVKGGFKATFEGMRGSDIGIASVEARNPEIKKELEKRSEQIGSKEDLITFGTTAGIATAWNTPVIGLALKGYLGKQAFDVTKKAVDEPTPKNVAEAGLIITPLIPSGAKVIKNVYKKTGATYIPPNEVFSPDVLQKGQKFPTSKSPEEIMSKFKKTKTDEGKLVGTHATTTSYDRETQIKAGSKAKKNMEDAGLYISSKGEASPYFLDVMNKGENYKLSLNPFKGLNKDPNLVNIDLSGISRLPKKVLNKAKSIAETKGNKEAFNYINNWYKKNTKTDAYIPLRTELGHTKETQAIIPEGTDVYNKLEGNIIQRTKGYKYYTIYNGEIIPIRDYAISKGKKIGKKEYNKILSELKNYEYKNYKYSRYGKDKYITPYPSIAYAGKYGSSKKSKYRRKYTHNYPSDNVTSYPTESLDYPIEGLDYPTRIKPNYPDKYLNKYPETATKYNQKYTTTRFNKLNEGEEKRRIALKSSKKLTAYQPIMITYKGNRIPLDFYPNVAEAQSEGFIATDESPEYKFKIIKKKIPNESYLKRGRDSKLSYKFKRIRNIYIEKKVYRKDKMKEGGKFNVFPYVFNTR